MAEWSGFFDAHKVGESWDRVYLAEDFAKFFSPLIGNGVFAGRSNELQVFQSVPAGMSVTISSGQSWIDGYGYLNDSDLTVFVDPADGALGRIDRIVNQWSAVDRQIRTVWKKGTPAVNPVAPTLRWDADYKELNLATLNISAGLSAITQDKIIDTRMDSSVCGWVTGLINQVDTSTLFLQWQTAYDRYFEEQKKAWEVFFGSIQEDIGIPIPSTDTANFNMAVNSQGNGYELTNHPKVATPTDETHAVNKAYVDGKHSVFGAILSASGWTNLGGNNYAQRITISGISQNDYLHITVNDWNDTWVTSKEEYSKIGRAWAEENGIYFHCYGDYPTVDIPIMVEVNR